MGLFIWSSFSLHMFDYFGLRRNYSLKTLAAASWLPELSMSSRALELFRMEKSSRIMEFNIPQQCQSHNDPCLHVSHPQGLKSLQG